MQIVKRITFHPEYSNFDFFGGYKPISDPTGKIIYEFVPGPFMELYVKAKTNKNEKYLLVIEEINRANAFSIFGDLFQLLDRKKW